MEQQELQFEVRDMRHKEKFSIDDAYLNGFAKKCGIYATGVYVSLCRHADSKTQECWPSIIRIAEELNISVASVKRALVLLEKSKIIIKKRMGKKLNNRYVLLDKSEWSDRAITQLPQSHHIGSHRAIHSKDTHSKDTQENATPDVVAVYPSFLDRLLESKQRHIHIIGLWAREKPIDLPNEEIYRSVIQRNLRPAKLLEGYDDKQIVETIGVIKRTDYLKKIALNTVLKYIDDVVVREKKDGPKIVKFEERKVNGKIIMKPIYAE